MNQRMQQVIRELNKVKRRKHVCEVIAIVIMVPALFVIPFLPEIDRKVIFLSLGIGSLLAFAAMFLGSEFQKLFRSMYKSEFVIPILREKLENVSYDWENGFDETDLNGFQIINCNLYGTGYFRSDDYLKASYNGVHFRQSDGLLTKAKGYRRVEVLFCGKVMEFNNLSMKANGLWCFSKNFDKRLRCSLPSMKPAVLEDERLSGVFDVYTSNVTDVNAILTPQIKEALLMLSEKYLFVGIHFKGDKLIIAVNNYRDTFDVSTSWKKINYEEMIKKFQQDADDIIEVIGFLEGKAENGR